MKIQVNFEDTDVYNVLSAMINHPNKEDYLKLLVPLVCDSQRATEWFFRLHMGTKLPEPLQESTLCYLKVNDLPYDANKNELRKSSLVNDQDQIVCRVKQFRGFHSYGNYTIVYTNILSDGSHQETVGAVDGTYLIPIEEF